MNSFNSNFVIDKSLYCKTHILSRVGRLNGNIPFRCEKGQANYKRGVTEKCEIVEAHTKDHQIETHDGKTFCLQCDYKPEVQIENDEPF